ncbi:YceI family protein [Chitinophagaceae bacterium LWZ2-11]
MKKIITLTAIIIGLLNIAHAQSYITKTGFIGFYSKTPFEDIKAENKQVYAVVDLTKKNIAFVLLLKGFIFPKELMQEHFNENYVESDKYPKASFSGAFTSTTPITGSGTYNVTVKGNLTLHNVTKQIEVPATLQVKDDKLSGKCEFKIKPEDYNISIPSVVRDKIAKDLTVDIQIDCSTLK